MENKRVYIACWEYPSQFSEDHQYHHIGVFSTPEAARSGGRDYVENSEKTESYRSGYGVNLYVETWEIDGLPVYTSREFVCTIQN